MVWVAAINVIEGEGRVYTLPFLFAGRDICRYN